MTTRRSVGVRWAERMAVIGVFERVDVQRRTQGRAIDVDDQPIRGGQGKDAVLDRAGQVEHQSCVVRRPPQANAVDLCLGHSVDGHRQKQHSYGSYHRAKAHT